MYTQPKYSPKAPISFTSPNPIASFPAISPPISVINKKIPAPTSIPNILFINTFIPVFTFVITPSAVNISPNSNIVKVNLFGIICNFKSMQKLLINIGNNNKYFNVVSVNPNL